MAHANPFLVVYDNETEGVFAISVPSKATKPWVVEYVKSVIYELGYGEMKISLKSDGARAGVSTAHRICLFITPDPFIIFIAFICGDI